MADATTKFAKNAGATVDSLQDDLSAVRDDVGKLSEQVIDLLSAKSNAAYKQAKKRLNSTADEITGAARDVRDTITDTVEEAVQERPLTTLAIAVGCGFVLGALWRR
jgi:ElaB/YqjD/DUF883 family membrane-anchored ribosome-binding protein